MSEEERQGSESSSGGGCFRAFLLSFLTLSLIGAAAIAYYRYCYMPAPAPPVVTESLRVAANSYDWLGEFYHGVAQARRGEDVYYIDTRGRLTDAPDTDKRRSHTPDETELQRVERGGLWGMINLVNHDTIVKPIYSTLSNYYDGFALATVKFGSPDDPEYLCYYGYVDTRGNHTFTAEQFEAVKQASARATRREYLATLPHGITARSLGLAEHTRTYTTRDSLGGRWDAAFDEQGVITRLIYTNSRGDARHYGILDGYITSTSIDTGHGIRLYRYTRQKDAPCHETIMRHSVEGTIPVGSITYSPDDGTATSLTFETLK